MSHQVVQLANGQWSLRSLDVEETYHPVVLGTLVFFALAIFPL